MWRLASLAYAVLVIGACLVPAEAETVSFVCSRTQADQANLIRLGYPTTAETVMHITIDTDARTAADLATYPGDSSGHTPTVYPATITSELVTWSTPPDEDGDKATRYFNRNTKTLNTVDPMGSSTMWDCA